MIIASANISIYERGSEQANGVKGLLEALQDFAKSRATRKLYRLSAESKVGCVMRVPLIDDECPVQTRALGRALRKVVRDAIGKAKAGDQFVVDFRVSPDARLHIELRAADEGGLDAPVFKQLHEA